MNADLLDESCVCQQFLVSGNYALLKVFIKKVLEKDKKCDKLCAEFENCIFCETMMDE